MRTVEELLNQKGHDVYEVSPDASVQDAIRLMAERNVGAVLVRADDEVLGILSERDCVRRVMLQGRSARDTRVGQVMSGSVQTVSRHDTIEYCMQQMTDRRLRHLPVVEDGQLLGMISVGDAVKAQLSDQEEIISGLESYIHGPGVSARSMTG
jgi:signal-transduction protein with cAMP-binding, CBS, and nucleotidyltransferase domain